MRGDMADPKTIRFNNADKLDRLDVFEKNLKRCGQNASEVIRNLTDAYNRFVDQHGHGPIFPVNIEPFETPKILPQPAKARKKRKAGK
jgi:hypothetical protein